MEIGAFTLGSDSSDSHTPSYVHMPDFIHTFLYSFAEKSDSYCFWNLCA